MVRTEKPQGTNEPVLTRILREAWDYQSSGHKFLAVFDLDSTLFDLTLRVAAILDDFTLEPANLSRFPTECDLLKKVQIRPTDWGLEEPLKRVGLTTRSFFFHALYDHWAKGFFSGDYLDRDEPLPGAVTYVEELHQAGAQIMYLTGRDVPRMQDGTAESLRSHGFPMDHDCVELVLKPQAHLDDAHFKLEVLKKAEAHYDRIWLFENEPVNLNLIGKECPEIGLVFIDTVHSGREDLKGVLDTITHFEVDLEELRGRR